MACYLDYVTCYTCTPSVCMCVTVSVRVLTWTCVRVHVPTFACVKSSSRHSHAGGVRAHSETDVVIYDKMPVKKRQSKCRDKERGLTRRDGMRNSLTETG